MTKNSYGLIDGRVPIYDKETWVLRMNGPERQAARKAWRFKHDKNFRKMILQSREKNYKLSKNKKCKNYKHCKKMINPKVNVSGFCFKCYWSNLKRQSKVWVKCKHTGCGILVKRNSKYQLCRKHYLEKRGFKKHG